MISAAVTFLDISTWVLMFIFAIVCLLMSTVILMQRPKNEGLGAAFGSGTTDQLFGARTTNVLQKGTVYLASLFFILVLIISILINHRPKTGTLVATPAATDVPTTPETPVTPPVLTPPPSSEENKPLESEPKAPDTTTPPESDETKPAAPPETPAPAPAPETTPAEKPAEEPK